MSVPFAAAARVVADAVSAGAFPGASVEVGRTTGPLWSESFGRVSNETDAASATAATVYDLASLTKVLATTPVLMRLVARGIVGLDDPVQRWLPLWRGADREDVTVEGLLAHASGLTAYLALYRDHTGRAEFERAVCTLPLEYPPWSRAVYSDLGFMLLAFIAESAAATPFEQLVRDALAPQGEPVPVFRPDHDLRRRCAPTGVDAWRGRLLVGEVNDQNAWALGGVAGHAGLFGTAAAVGTCARTMLRGLRGAETPVGPPALLARFARRTTVPDSSRALGWDTMLPTSSCGTRLSPTAIGHTGFTGTSLWIDWAADAYYVLLTNRVHPTAENDAILSVRPAFHDAAAQALAGLGPAEPNP
jgi:CubicO group peptidase (beta-lactamase class C family)